MCAQPNVLSQKQVRAILSDVLEKENLSEADLVVSSGSQKGDGNLSYMTKVNVNGNNKTLHLIVKWAPKSEEFRKLMPIRQAFLREIYFYDTLVPAIAKFQADRNVPNPFNCTVKCYKTVSEEFGELLVLDDIRKQRFGLHDRSVLMDEAHITLILKEYGKFHAVSFAMQDQDMDLYKKLTENINDLFVGLGDVNMKEFKRNIETARDIFDKDEYADLRNALDDFKDNKLDPFLNGLDCRNKYNAISHGDCWCNNMMFKYEENSFKPSQLCLFDFQIVRVNSPAIDLSYLIYASGHESIYNNLDRYLEIYYDSLADHMKAMGSDATKMYPFVELKNDWKKYCLFGFMMATLIHKTSMKSSEDMVDAMDVAEGGKDISDMFTLDGEKKAIADEKTRKLALHVFASGFLN